MFDTGLNTPLNTSSIAQGKPLKQSNVFSALSSFSDVEEQKHFENVIIIVLTLFLLIFLGQPSGKYGGEGGLRKLSSPKSEIR